MESFEIIDYVFILIVLLSTLFGFARGFLREAFTIANVLLASLFTFYFYPYSYEFFAKQITNHTVIVACSVFGVFIVSWILIAIVNSFLIDSLGKAKGSRFDKLMGTALGLLRGLFIVISIYMGVAMGYKAQTEEKNMPEWMTHARTYNFVKMQSQYFIDMMPGNFRKIYNEGSGELMDNVVGSLTPISDDEKKLMEYDLSLKNIKTLKEIMKDMLPSSQDRKYEFRDMAKLEKMEFKNYATDLIDDYNDYLLDGRVKPRLDKQEVESLRNAVRAIKEDETDQDVYKGVY